MPRLPVRLIRLSTSTLLSTLLLAGTGAGAAFAATPQGNSAASVAAANVGKGPCDTNSAGGTGFLGSCSGEEWCADFAKWAWYQAGAIDTGTITAAAYTFAKYGTAHGTFHWVGDSGYTPQPGDAVIWAGSSRSLPSNPSDLSFDDVQHVSLVKSVISRTNITTIGGNENNSVQQTPGLNPTVNQSWNQKVIGYISPVGTVSPSIPAGFNVTVDANGTPLTNGRTVSGVVGLTAPPTSQGVINALYYNFTGPNGVFTINGGTGANNYAQSWNTTALPNGTYTLQAGANEIDGQAHSYPAVPISFTVNNTAPVPSTPGVSAPGGQVFGQIQLSASGLGGNTASVTYKVDGGQVGNSTAGGAFPLTVDTTALSDGPHTVTASAVNATGGASPDSSAATFTVDNSRSHTASQAAAQSNGTVDMLYKAGDGTLGHAFYKPGAWVGPATVSASMASQPSTVTTSAGVVDSFWEGTDGNLWHATYFPGSGPVSGWQPPSSLGMGPLGGAPKAVADSVGTIDVFWNGGGNAPHLWHAWFNAGGTWHGPQDLTPDIPAAGAVTGDPSPVTSSPGVVDVFWKGADNNLWHVNYVPGGGNGTGWQAPNSLGMGPLGGTPKAVGQITGTVDVFWKGTGSSPELWHAWWNNGQPWAGPQDLGGANLQSDPVPVNSGPGLVDVFWQGIDNNLWHSTFYPGTGTVSGWQAPNSLGMGPLGGAPFASSEPNGTIDVFWKGSGPGSGNIWHTFWNGGQVWAPPSNLGGDMAAN